jgi:hypothetical protein
MRAIAAIRLAVLAAAALAQISITPARSQSVDNAARCQSIEDAQRKQVCLNSTGRRTSPPLNLLAPSTKGPASNSHGLPQASAQAVKPPQMAAAQGNATAQTDPAIFVANSPPTNQTAGTGAVGGIIIGGLLILAILFLIVRAAYRSNVRKRTGQKAAAIIKEHLPSLIRRREQLVRQDAYGKLLMENWVKEVSYFIEEHIKPYLTPEERDR